MRDNWNFTLTIKISADNFGDIAELLGMTVKRILTGKTSGNDAYCIGAYEFSITTHSDKATSKDTNRELWQ